MRIRLADSLAVPVRAGGGSELGIRHGTLNALLLIGMLIVSTLFQSEIGGGDSNFGAITLALVGAFIAINLQVNHKLAYAFALAAAFLGLSVVANLDTLSAGGYRSAISTAAGLALFTLKPVPLHYPFFQRLLVLFLAAVLLLSVGIAVRGDAMDFSRELTNANFNVNPNSASLFFVQCLLLALAFAGGRVRWLIAIPLMLLTITTGSRAGAICMGLAVIGFAMFAEARGQTSRAGAAVLRLLSNWRIGVVIAITAFLAARYIPDATEFLLVRFEVNSSRADQWNASLSGITTTRDWLFGNGPANLETRTGETGGAHSSYIAALGNSGLPFLLTTLISLGIWWRYLVQRGHRDMLWIVPPILVYGIVETILFNGVQTVWLLLMIAGIVVQARPAVSHVPVPKPLTAAERRLRVARERARRAHPPTT